MHASNHVKHSRGHVLQSHVGQYFATCAELYLSGGYGFMLTSYLALEEVGLSKPHLLFSSINQCPACALCAGVVGKGRGEKKEL